jgi:hypothetical protein
MNEDNLITEYKKTWEQVKLSDSSRQKMGENLKVYASFHKVTENPVLVKSPFSWLLLRPVQFAFMFVLMIGVGTTMYLGDQNTSVPFATIEAPTNLEAVPAPDQESETKEAGDSLASSPPETNTIFPVDEETIDVSSNDVRSFAMKESDDMAEDEMYTTMLSQGVMDINDYRADVTKREKTYRALITKYDTSIEDDVRADLIAKLNTTLTLVSETEGKEESKARPLLDKAATLVGEVEAVLSTLGQAEVKDGVIIDIDFSIDPMSGQ